jgi:hypothetical protein
VIVEILREMVGGNENVIQEEAPLNQHGHPGKMNTQKVFSGVYFQTGKAIQKWKS